MDLHELFPRQPIEEYQCDECKNVFNNTDVVYYIEASETIHGTASFTKHLYITKLCKECILSKYSAFKPALKNENTIHPLDIFDCDDPPVQKRFCLICNNEIIMNDKIFEFSVVGYSFEAGYLEYGLKFPYQNTADIENWYLIASYCEKCHDDIKENISLNFIQEIAKAKLSD